MRVRSEPLTSPTVTPAKRKAPRIGFLTPGAIERAFIALLYLTLLLLVVLSFIGTFYGLGGNSAPLLTPGRIVADIRANTDRLWVAVVLQLVLMLAQYGTRQMARHDRRWWFLYLAALGISMYYNFMAYWTPLAAMLGMAVAGIIIVVGDILPEFIAMRHE